MGFQNEKQEVLIWRQKFIQLYVTSIKQQKGKKIKVALKNFISRIT
jgi:hypothetical protein